MNVAGGSVYLQYGPSLGLVGQGGAEAATPPALLHCPPEVPAQPVALLLLPAGGSVQLAVQHGLLLPVARVLHTSLQGRINPGTSPTLDWSALLGRKAWRCALLASPSDISADRPQ